MKNNIKKLLPAYILSFAVSFMLFIYEPILMYTNNVNDFWFDLITMLKPVLFFGGIVFVAQSIIYTVLYFLYKPAYKVAVIIEFILFVTTYIQGNFLAGHLPVLEGSTINWNEYIGDMVISAILLVVISAITIFSTIRFKFEKCSKVYSYISLAITAMILTSLLSVLLTTENVFLTKDEFYVTTNNINKASKDQNLFIFVLDTMESNVFYEILQNSEKYSNILDDFTYYPDTMGAYNLTRDSIPFIISGIWNENETEYIEYYKKAINESKLLNELNKRNYNVNIYDAEVPIYRNDVENFENYKFAIKYTSFIKQELKYILFKYLPYYLKPFSKIDTLDFAACKGTKDATLFTWDDRNFYDSIRTKDLEIIDEKYFNFTHLEGAHVPYNYDKNLERTENGTYSSKLEAMLIIIDEYLNRLKESNVYDNSAIIIMADHGRNLHDNYDTNTNQNPILFVKGINEKHTTMNKSEIPVSFADLNEAYMQLLDGKIGEEVFENIDKNKKRRLIHYNFAEEDHMVEYEQTGKAWDDATLVLTGREFDR